MRYLCSICGVANDPLHYAMEQLGKRWYHKICLKAAANWAISKGFKLDFEKIK